jgi:hypothetical protein
MYVRVHVLYVFVHASIHAARISLKKHFQAPQQGGRYTNNVQALNIFIPEEKDFVSSIPKKNMAMQGLLLISKIDIQVD